MKTASYYIVYQAGFSYNPASRCYICATAQTLEEAKANRVCGGDLVVDRHMAIVPDKSWLWDWELRDPRAYAHRAILSALSRD
jgi:hypothetical protein